jgi:hypothetical protein
MVILPDASAYSRPELGGLLFGLRERQSVSVDPRELPDDVERFRTGRGRRLVFISGRSAGLAALSARAGPVGDRLPYRRFVYLCPGWFVGAKPKPNCWFTPPSRPTNWPVSSKPSKPTIPTSILNGCAIPPASSPPNCWPRKPTRKPTWSGGWRRPASNCWPIKAISNRMRPRVWSARSQICG